jgi:hypothetical protein
MWIRRERVCAEAIIEVNLMSNRTLTIWFKRNKKTGGGFLRVKIKINLGSQQWLEGNFNLSKISVYHTWMNRFLS